MADPQTALDLAVWKAEGHPLVVEYSLRALDEICRVVTGAYYSSPGGGVEVGGVLFGSRGNNSIRVMASRPLPCEYSMGPVFILSPYDEGGLRQILEASGATPELKGLVPLGWYHSHVRSDIFLSKQDLEVYNRYFPKSWQVALVLRPGRLSLTKAGFFLREPDGSIRTESSYREFSLKPAPKPDSAAPVAEAGPKAEPEPEPEPPAEVPPPPASPEAKVSPALPPIEPPKFLDDLDGPRWWVQAGVVLAALAILVGGGLGVRALWRVVGAPPRDLGLRVSESDAHLRIEWDRHALGIVEGVGGTLEIEDGKSRSKIELGREQLQSANVTYVRQGDTIQVRLIVRQLNGVPVEASAVFLGQPIDAPIHAVQQEDPSAEELQDLRDQLNKEQAKSRNLQRQLKALQDKQRVSASKKKE